MENIMAAEQELTPEEKLLKVIQKGEPKAEPTEKTLGKAPEEGNSPEPVAVESALPSAGRWMTVVNRILAAAAIVFLLLAGYESYLNFPTPAVAYPADTLALDATVPALPPATLSDTLDMFAKRRVFGQPPPAATTSVGTTNTVNLIGWRAYARENLTLIGMSDVKRSQDGGEKTQREAIVMDNKVKKMHFLTDGKTLILAEQEVAVSQVGDAFVEFKLGEEVLKIE
jgi:hypothetical protein